MLKFLFAKHFNHVMKQLLISVVQTNLWLTNCISVYTPEQLAEKYSNVTFLLYLLALISIVALHHYIYK